MSASNASRSGAPFCPTRSPGLGEIDFPVDGCKIRDRTTLKAWLKREHLLVFAGESNHAVQDFVHPQYCNMDITFVRYTLVDIICMSF